MEHYNGLFSESRRTNLRTKKKNGHKPKGKEGRRKVFISTQRNTIKRGEGKKRKLGTKS